MKLKSALTTAIVFIALPAMGQSSPPGGSKPAQPPAAQSKPGGNPSAGTSAPLGTVDPAKATAIRHLMDVTGSAKLGEEVGTFITNQVRQGVSHEITPEDRTQKFMDAFAQQFATRYKPAQVDDAAVSIYGANLSIEDIQAITQFYESPVGQRMIKALPNIVQQSQAAGMQIGQTAALETLRAMSTDYPELKGMLPQDAPSIAPTPGSGQSGSQSAPKLTPIPQQH